MHKIWRALTGLMFAGSPLFVAWLAVCLAAACVTKTALGAPPPGYQLVWSDEFDGNSLDTTRWRLAFRDNQPWRDAITVHDAVSVGNGHLTITTFSDNQGNHYTGPYISTQNLFSQAFGYFEARIEFNSSSGMWSGFWMLSPAIGNPIGDPATAGTEIDIVEHRAVDRNDNPIDNAVHNAVHWDGYGREHKAATPANDESFSTLSNGGFHTYGLEWTPSYYRFYFDGQPYGPPYHRWPIVQGDWRFPNPISHTAQYILLSSEIQYGASRPDAPDVGEIFWAGNIPAGGYGSLASSTTKMNVDWVRVYSLPEPPIVSRSIRLLSSSSWRSNDTFSLNWETINFNDSTGPSAWPFAWAPYPSATPTTTLIPGTHAEPMWHCGEDGSACKDASGMITGRDGPTEAFFRHALQLDLAPDGRPLIGKAKINVDDDYDLYVNGNLVFENHDGGFADVVDTINFSSSLQDGRNVFAIEAVDGGWDNPRPRLDERVLFDATILQQGDLLVISRASINSSSVDGDVLRYDGKAGAFIDEFANGCNPVDLVYGPDGRLYVADTDHPLFGGCDNDNIVARYNGLTGEFEEFNDPHADFIPLPHDSRFDTGPGGLTFGPEGNLYVSDPGDDSVHRYQGPFGANPGQFIDTFVASASGGLDEPTKLLFGSDGNLYVISKLTNSVLRYEGPSGDNPGAFVDDYVWAASGGLDAPSDLAFGRDERLYVISAGSDAVLRYQGLTETSPGAFIDAFVPSIGFSNSLAFGPDGDLFVTNSSILRYDGETGAFKGTFASVRRAGELIFSAIPDFVADLGNFNGDDCVDLSDLTGELLPAIRSGSTDPRFDLNGDGRDGPPSVNIADARKLVLLFDEPRGAPCP